MVGTLRDQLLYPVPPARVWKGTSQSDKQLFTSIAGEEPNYKARDDGEPGGLWGHESESDPFDEGWMYETTLWVIL